MGGHPKSPRMGHRSARDGVLILGGGFGGATVAQGLGTGTLVTRENALLFTPLLPEVASGSLEPRHGTVPLRQICPGTELMVGEVVWHDPSGSTVRVVNEVGELELSYEHLVVAVGATSRVLPIPGLAEHAVGFKNFEDALYLRNHVLRELELADNELSLRRQQEHLTFVFIGAGYAGVEALAELQELVSDAIGYYPDLREVPQRWVLVEVLDRILPTIPERLAAYAAQLLEERGVEIRTGSRVTEVREDGVALDSGEVITAHTVVWSAGVAPAPVVERLGLPLDEGQRIKVDPYLRVEGHDNIWALGDCAAVPNNATPGRIDPPTSQHALRQGRQLARNLAAVRQGRSPARYGYRALGQVATLGRYKGIAEVLGIRMSGFLGWFITRSYHLYALPLASRRLRVVADWTVALFFRRDIASLGGLREPPRLGQPATPRPAAGQPAASGPGGPPPSQP